MWWTFDLMTREPRCRCVLAYNNVIGALCELDHWPSRGNSDGKVVTFTGFTPLTMNDGTGTVRRGGGSVRGSTDHQSE